MTDDIVRLRRALDAMNRVCLHQTNRYGMAPMIGEEEHRTVRRVPAHPLTCGTDSRHAPLYPYFNGVRVVLICRYCDYTQTNCAGFDT